MRKINAFGLILLLTLLTAAFIPERVWAVVNPSGTSQSEEEKELKIKKPKFMDGELLVRFKKGVTKDKAKQVHAKVGSEIVRSYSVPADLYHVKIKKNAPLEEIIQEYTKDPDVLYAEPNFIYSIQTVPNDPSFGSLWGLNNTGQTGGAVDADINAPEAWDVTTGSPETIVAVIDTGVDYNHEDLAANIWTNPGEIPGNGIDDDGNGYIDDVHGINAITGSGNPMDDNNHGTHVSGTIAAIGNNGIGVAGVNWNAKIIACKFLNSNGSGYASDALECLWYLYKLKTRATNPVNIVLSSNSWGGGSYSQSLYDAIDTHRGAGMLFVAAAGNSSANANIYSAYPASYYLPNVISVAATDHNDELAYFSNYGSRTVHVGAPGVNILSTTIGNTYASYNGTSMATPHVSGLVALLKSQDPARDWKTLKNLVLAAGQSTPGTAGATISGKRIRAWDASGAGSLSCENQVVGSRLRPVQTSVTLIKGLTLDLAYQHINCGTPNGEVGVAVSDGSQIVLHDDGVGIDQEAGDGIYSGQWIAAAYGDYALSFPGDDTVLIQVIKNYQPAVQATFNYRSITGTKLTLGDDAAAEISSPFPVLFGNYSSGFTSVYVTSNGIISFTEASHAYRNTSLPDSWFRTLVAPFWDDLDPGAGGGIYWAVVGSAPNRELVFEWRDVPRYGSSGTVKFQTVFTENSPNVLFNYADVIVDGSYTDAGGSATVGVQTTTTVAQQYSYNTPSLTNGLSLFWRISSLLADAGADRFALPDSLVKLDGTGSSGMESPITGYEWVQTAGTAVVLSNADTATPTFTAPTTFETLTFRLTVTDAEGSTSFDYADVIVNLPPMADAGSNQIVMIPATVKLDGRGSQDENGTIVSYLWEQTGGPAVTLSGSKTAVASFYTSVTGTRTFRLTVIDNNGESATDTVTVAVKAAPEASAGLDKTIYFGDTVTLDGTYSRDTDGTVVRYEWVQTGGTTVALTDADTAQPSFIAPAGGVSLSFQLTVTDNDGYTDTDSVSLLVRARPVVEAGPDQAVYKGTTVTLSGSAYDTDGTVRNCYWSLVSGATVTLTNPYSWTPSFTAPNVHGTLTFKLTVWDNDSVSGYDTVTVVVKVPPVAYAKVSSVYASTNEALTLSGSSSYDPDGTISIYRWEQVSGPPVSLTNADKVNASFTPDRAGTLTFRLTVTDNDGYSSFTNITLRALDGYHPPRATAYNYRTFQGTYLAIGTDASVELTSPFPIHFGADPEGFTALHVSDNGIINFQSAYGSAAYTTLPMPTRYYLVAPLWTQLRSLVYGSSAVHWAVLGEAPNRELVVEWWNMTPDGWSPRHTFEVVFFENSSDILFNYQTSGNAGKWATIGIQHSAHYAQQYCYNAACLTDNMALLWKTNFEPVASAGPDQVVLVNSSVALDGRASSDEDGTIASYAWLQTGGTPVTLTGADTATPGFTAPHISGNLTFQLTVTDNKGVSSVDEVIVTVNAPPVVDAGPDRVETAGTTVVLDGSQSHDGNGTISSYAWVQTFGTPVAMTGSDTATPGFTAPVVSDTLKFMLTVTDNLGATASDEVIIIVNILPVANAGPDKQILPGSSAVLNGTGSFDPDGAIASYAWTQTGGASVSLMGATTATPGFTAPNISGTLTFQLTVTDDKGATSSDTVTISVNLPPVANAGQDQIVKTRSIVTLSGAASSDADGTIASYSWVQTAGVSVALSGAGTAAPSFTAPDATGTLTFQLTVTDNKGATASDQVVITVTKTGR